MNSVLYTQKRFRNSNFSSRSTLLHPSNAISHDYSHSEFKLNQDHHSRVVKDNLTKLKNLRKGHRTNNNSVLTESKDNQIAFAEIQHKMKMSAGSKIEVPLITSDLAVPLNYEKLVKLPFIKQGRLTRKYLKMRKKLEYFKPTNLKFKQKIEQISAVRDTKRKAKMNTSKFSPKKININIMERNPSEAVRQSRSFLKSHEREIAPKVSPIRSRDVTAKYLESKTSRDTTISPIEFSSSKANISIKNLRLADKIKELQKERFVICLDIHTYLKHVDPKNRALRNGDYRELFPETQNVQFPYKTHLCLKLDINSYFRKYLISIPKEVKRLSKSMINTQNKLYQRAAEELLEYCNEEMISAHRRQLDNFRSDATTRNIEESDLVAFSEMANTDGSIIKKVSDVKHNIILLLKYNEMKLLRAIVMKTQKKKEIQHPSRTRGSIKNIIADASNNWYSNNLKNWKYQSQQKISSSNIQNYIKKFNPAKDSSHLNKSMESSDNFVYDNGEYINTTMSKYSSVEPAMTKSPVNSIIKVEDTSDLRDMENNFFKTQNRIDSTKRESSVPFSLTSNGSPRVSLKSAHKLSSTKRRSLYRGSFIQSKGAPSVTEYLKSSENNASKEKEDTSITYQTVKKVSQKYNLPNKEVYELMTQYNSMVTISQEPDKVKPGEPKSPEIKSPKKDESFAKGIKLKVLNQYSKLLADKHPDVVPMILRGVGVDVDARDPRISMKAFMNLNCILEYGVAEKDELIQFWTRVLDPENKFLVKKENVIDFFDKLSKGRFSKTNHQIFSYAKDVWQFFELKGLLTTNNTELDINRLRKDMTEGTIDTQVFSDIFTVGFDPEINQK
ncbi:unnamed protein product [Moneuplotes crassus]|uniref:Uncharacterized protein n=1 Tax=Euplotes crassus TaxID=5936 RepID=A0AAD1Y2J7_EUPCR|nr:unnamed protein product [Moneuplotes crassus]